jgi:glutathione S-transferase
MLVLGSKISYFTGKFETYLRYKEIPYTFRALDLRHYRWVVPRRLGATQLPSVRLDDGRWMSDTTPMIAWLEQRHPQAPMFPEESAQLFVSLLIEDYADEWLWRPYVSRRQRRLFVRGDGIDADTRAHAEGAVTRFLACLEPVLQRRPFLFGDRPTIADIALMGPVWRHFVHDPTPARLMQETAPAVFEWAARMWNARARALGGGGLLGGIPEDIAPLLDEIGETHLEALAANALAHRDRQREHGLTVQGTTYRRVPTSAYRVWCLEQLRARFQELPPDAAATVAAHLQRHGCWEPLWRVGALASGHDPAGQAPFCRVTRMVRD